VDESVRCGDTDDDTVPAGGSPTRNCQRHPDAIRGLRDLPNAMRL